MLDSCFPGVTVSLLMRRTGHRMLDNFLPGVDVSLSMQCAGHRMLDSYFPGVAVSPSMRGAPLHCVGAPPELRQPPQEEEAD